MEDKCEADRSEPRIKVTLTVKEMRVEFIDRTGTSLYQTRVQNRAMTDG
jgi:hypothetical protein